MPYEDDDERDPAGNDDERGERDTHLAPEARAAEKVAELRMHAELAAVYEGPRKFEAQLVLGLDADVARDVQRAMAKFERAKIERTPVINADAMPEAVRILTLCDERSLTTNDYHVYRRPGEVMIVRWLLGEQVETFYERYQAHCDAALEGAREDERDAIGWKGGEKTTKYLELLDDARLTAAELYAREPIRQHQLCALATTAADEMNIRFLCEHLMGVETEALVGANSAPSAGARDSELAWFFKLFGLRGSVDRVERMCFFTFLQKSDDDDDFGL